VSSKKSLFLKNLFEQIVHCSRATIAEVTRTGCSSQAKNEIDLIIFVACDLEKRMT